jgi:hypothetical protein
MRTAYKIFVTCQTHRNRELHLNFCPIYINSVSLWTVSFFRESFYQFRHLEKFLNKLKHFQGDLTDDVNDKDIFRYSTQEEVAKMVIHYRLCQVLVISVTICMAISFYSSAELFSSFLYHQSSVGNVHNSWAMGRLLNLLFGCF